MAGAWFGLIGWAGVDGEGFVVNDSQDGYPTGLGAAGVRSIEGWPGRACR
ncbi:hypothetical protein K227x_07370 [Rubripirellula lacrimiformis]|uniref:Uncharacterized protein n=1 Tax=Rubripirellula lacrimiformis TaxID=1930273 RepID=A0A517N5G6_9BACT|nr:hypothetical protein K227x_07370 [Rubripirellula lacrimiformis]